MSNVDFMSEMVLTPLGYIRDATLVAKMSCLDF